MEIETELQDTITTENFIKFHPGGLNKDYQVIKKITDATFGGIYLVFHELTKEKRCLKVYNREKMKNTNQNKFVEEINLVKKLDHPNIFKIFEFYKDKLNYYLITEYLGGGELFDYIAS